MRFATIIMIPTTSKSISAMYRNPESASPTRNKGSKIRRNKIFVTPQAARNAKPIILPKTASIKITNTIFSISFLL